MTSRKQAAPCCVRRRRGPSDAGSAPAFNDPRTAETRPSRVAVPRPPRPPRVPSVSMTVSTATGTLESP